VLIGGGLYAAMLALLKAPELQMILGLVRRFLPGVRKAAGD